MRRLVIVAFAFTLAACGSTRPPALPSARSPQERWQQLLDAGSKNVTYRSHANVRINDGHEVRRFKANLAVTGDRMRVDLLTPLGTTAATLYADASRILLLNHLEQTYWEGSRAQLRRTIPALSSFVTLGPRSGLLLVGLPVVSGESECSAAADRQVCRAAGAEYVTVAEGLERVSSGGAEVVFDPPAFPPLGVRLTEGAVSLEFEHIEIVETNDATRPLTRPSEYRCCAVTLGEK